MVVSFLLGINLVLVVISVVRNIILHIRSSELFCDHIWIYRECSLALKGMDMSEAIKNGIGTVAVSSTWPWAKILGIIVHGAFLTESASLIYEVVFYFVFVSVSCILISKRLFKESEVTGSGVNKLQVILVFLSSWYYVYLACAFNNGSFVCLAIMLALVFADDNPILTGIIMAFAMIKAQIALPFFVVFLFRKKWKVIWTSVSIVLLSWLSCCILTHITPWRQISNLLNGQLEVSGPIWMRYGMFDFIMLFDNSKALLSMILSIIAGLAMLVFAELKGIDDEIKRDYKYLSYYDAAIVSLLWMYTTKCDFLILTVVALGALEMWQRSIKDRYALLVCGGIMACMLMNLTNLVARAMALVGIIEAPMAKPLEGRFDSVLLLIVFSVITYVVRKKDEIQWI
jgi:hypothetical protein